MFIFLSYVADLNLGVELRLLNLVNLEAELSLLNLVNFRGRD
jgi:hypothetical protein